MVGAHGIGPCASAVSRQRSSGELRAVLLSEKQVRISAKSLVHHLGFEPRYAACKTAVLPLDERWMVAAEGFEPSAMRLMRPSQSPS